MKAVSTLPVPGCTIPLLRPLLGLTRDEIAARMAGLPYREDHTNAENEVKRNKLRNLVFPVFKDINPSFVETLARDMARFADAQTIVDAYFAEHPEEAAGMADRASGRTADGTVDGAYGFDAPLPEKPVRYTVTEEPWDGSQSVLQPAGTLILDADRLPGAAGLFVPGMSEGSAMVATGNTISPASLLEECFWTPGDWIRPLGAGGRKKLQDWFTDHHIPIPLKHATPLLRAVQPSGDDAPATRHPAGNDTSRDARHPASDNLTPDSRRPATAPHHILVIVGHTIDDSLRVTASTRRILRITVLP
jgi:tRNA(Ile)-lysidine synthase